MEASELGERVGVQPVSSFAVFIIASLVFHVFVFIVVPFTSQFIWKHKQFERPKTFQIVSVGTMQQMISVQKNAQVNRKTERASPNKNVTPVPARKNKPANETRETKEELEELDDFLKGLDKPVSSIGAVSNFPYDWYLRSIEQKVQQSWRPPVDNPDLYVVVSFAIFPNGTISDVTVARSSGNRMMDNLAVFTIKEAAPFGKLPPQFRQDKLEIDHTLRATTR